MWRVLLIVGSIVLASAGARAQTDQDLAMRFRPFVKTSLDGAGGQEQFRPVTWQWYVSNSSLVRGDKFNPHVYDLLKLPSVPTKDAIVAPSGWDPGLNDLLSKGSDLTLDAKSEGFELILPVAAIHGEEWPHASAGDGVYAHVERLGLPPSSGKDTRLVNIDYTFIWSFNQDRGRFDLHWGDITFLVVLYDPMSDRIVRLTFPAHGCLLQIYQLQPFQTITTQSLAGQDFAGKSQPTTAVKVAIGGDDTAIDTRGDCTSGLTAKSDAHVFLVADPQSGKFEHPVVFVENGTHESWPGQSGYMTTAGSHNGKGPSWLPKGLTLLARYDSDPNANTPFLHFNGAFGSDGASLVLHRTWCWPTDPSGHYAPCSHFYAPLLPHAVSIPDEVDHVPGNRFSDNQPYEKIGGLVWPQVVDVPTSGDVFAVSAAQAGNGQEAHPFGGVDVALSAMPAGWTLHLQAGAYPAETLTKPVTILGWNGAVTFGAP